MSPPPRLTTYCPVCGCEVSTFGVRLHLNEDHTVGELVRAEWRTGSVALRVGIVLVFLTPWALATAAVLAAVRLIGG